MKTKAAVLTSTKQVDILDLEIPKLSDEQVLVKIAYSGLCRTQLMEINGLKGPDKYIPHCLGHEASGYIVETWAKITKIKTGDPVVLSWMKGSGLEGGASSYKYLNQKVNAGSITTFMNYAVISENRIFPIPRQTNMINACLLGCVIPTAYGAVINTAGVKQGSNVAVWGCGGIGLMIIQALKFLGCKNIFAIDLFENKLSLASKLGATQTINGSTANSLEEILKSVPNGIDYSFESSGSTSVMPDALSATKKQGGKLIIIGNTDYRESFNLQISLLNDGRQILGSWGGDNKPDHHFPRYIKWLGDGEINVNELNSMLYQLEDINLAIENMETGKAVRPIFYMPNE